MPFTKLLFLQCLQLLGLFIFLQGYFPLKKAIPGAASLSDYGHEPIFKLANDTEHDTKEEFPETVTHHTETKSNQENAMFQRLIIVLIDALKADFVFNSTGPHMEYVLDLIENNKTFNFVARAHPPTVTMPRIKALTTGGIPGFVDVVLNFNSQELLEDNLIDQFYSAKKNIIFYGDDTWIKLFPEKFIRSDGTTSFYVTDYTEVDDNVTQYIEKELKMEDWDVMILHYLGLDHIGHMAGPFSPLVQPKLTEMDSIVKNLYSKILEVDKRTNSSTLLVLCGDHGMSDQGSHGGASASETATPLVFMSSVYDAHSGIEFTGTEIYQIDFVPNICMMFGLPIPQNSLGLFSPSLFKNVPSRRLLRYAYLNAQQLARIFLLNTVMPTKDHAYLIWQQAEQAHHRWLEMSHTNTSSKDVLDKTAWKIGHQYVEAMKLMREKLAASLANYDMHAIAVGIMLMWMVLFGLLGNTSLTLRFSFVGVALTGLLMSVHVVCCTSIHASGLLCTGYPLSFIMSCFLILVAYVWVVNIADHGTLSFVSTPKNFVGYFLLVGTLVHTLSLMSSSLVEEEHQTWYFWTVSLFVLLIRHSFTVNTYGAIFAVLLCCRVLRSWNQTGIKWADRTDVADYLLLPQNKVLLSALVITALVLFILLILRRRLGALWCMSVAISSIGIYTFRAASGALLLPITFPLSNKGVTEARIVLMVIFVLLLEILYLFAKFLCKDKNDIKKSSETVSTEEENGHQLRNINDKNKSTDWDKCHEDEANKQQFENHVKSEVNIKSTSQEKNETKMYFSSDHEKLRCIWMIVCLLLVRPHNIPMMVLIFIQEELISKAVVDYLKLNVFCLTLVYIWMGQAAFYYQGNSNSISTVDVSAGYVGLTDYQPAAVLFFLLCSTYAGPIYWITCLLLNITERCAQETTDTRQFLLRYIASMGTMGVTAALTRALPLAVYSVLVTIQRYHLFVWSVFSPKLLYEGVHTVVITMILVVLSIVVHLVTSKQQ